MTTTVDEPHDVIAELDRRIAEVVAPACETFGDWVVDLAAAGKRLRARFVWSGAHHPGFSGCQYALVDAMVAVELFHLATLVHDDVIDRDLERRGCKSAYAQLGADGAIVLGDWLFGESFARLGQVGGRVDILGACLRSLSVGQQSELMAKGTVPTDENDLWTVIDGKTASLFVTAAALGATLEPGACDAADLDAMRALAAKFGRAFQLLDDLDDLLIGRDVAEGVCTLPLWRSIMAAGRADDFEFPPTRSTLVSVLGPSREPVDVARQSLQILEEAAEEAAAMGSAGGREIERVCRLYVTQARKRIRSWSHIETVDRRRTSLVRAIAHFEPGVTHKAMSLQIIDSEGRWLLQRRAAGKALFAGRWSNSCCTHLPPGASPADTIRHRAFEELGVVVDDVHALDSFAYRAVDTDTGYVEDEVDQVYTAIVSSATVVSPDLEEVDEFQWLDEPEARKLLASSDAAPWAGEVGRIVARWVAERSTELGQ